MAVKTGDVARDTRHVDLLNLRSGVFSQAKGTKDGLIGG